MKLPKFNTSWKDQLHFTRSERSGVIGLSVLILIAFIFPHIYIYFFYNEKQVDFSEFQAQVEAFYEEYEPPKMKHYDEYKPKKWKNNPKEEGKKYAYKARVDDEHESKMRRKKFTARQFPFDPNTASFKELTSLGLSKKTANTLINFRKKGGRFYKKTDLKKVYGLSKENYDRLENYINIPKQSKAEKSKDVVQKEVLPKEVAPVVRLFTFDPNTATFDDFVTLGLSKKISHTVINFREKGGKFYKKQDFKKIYALQASDYSRLEPYINIPAVAVEETDVPKPILAKAEAPKPKPAPVNININTATPDDWQKLYGIGPTYAKRIVKYREALGGFHAVSQVGETYGIADSTFQHIRPQLQFDAASVRTININIATKDDLAAHPYISWKKAKTIIAYRKEHGAFQSVQDVSKIRAISSDLFERLKPYLSIE